MDTLGAGCRGSVGFAIAATAKPVASVERLPVWPEAKQLVEQLSELSEGAQSQPAFRFISVDGSELTIVDWALRVQRF